MENKNLHEREIVLGSGGDSLLPFVLMYMAYIDPYWMVWLSTKEYIFVRLRQH